MPFQKFRLGCLGLFLFLGGFLGGVAAFYYFERASSDEKTTYRLDGAAPVRPTFLRDHKSCKDLSEIDRRLDQAMLDAAVSADSDNASFVSPVHSNVVSYFSWHWNFYGKGRCPPASETIEKLAPILRRVGWPQVNTPFNDLRLAERLPVSKSTADGLASISFLGSIPPSDFNQEDVRPYARQLLAEQGEYASAWSKQAFEEIGGDTRLGTSAAYLAVATNPNVALPKVQQVMIDKLSSSRKRRIQVQRNGGKVSAFRPDDANRLIELGYALARAGNRAAPHSQPVIDMLDEWTARPAPPFGMMAAHPTEFCRIALHIGGETADAAKAKPFCAQGFNGGDGAPRQF